jgi:peptidoglycan hydrolase-like protein with peptidoglycan-binding domain
VSGPSERVRRLALRGALPAAGAAAVVAGVWLLVDTGGSNSTASGSGAGTTATAVAARRDLVERESVEGTLGFLNPRTVVSQSAGTLTRMAPEGSTVTRGEALFEVDGRRVPLLYGRKPAWRPFTSGMSDGEDVRQLEENLRALGYDPDGDIEVDTDYDWATQNAVSRMQEGLALPEDGALAASEVVFLPGARRVGSHLAPLGSQLQPGAVEIMETTSTTRAVTVALEASKQRLVARGDTVTVELPDEREVAGSVTSVGSVAETPSSEGAAADAGSAAAGGTGDEEPTVEVIVRLKGTRAPTRFDEAPVQVGIASERVENALSVPVTALLALAGGGYAVEVAGSRERRLVAVDVGLFADGYVQVSGSGVRAGTRVVVPE